MQTERSFPELTAALGSQLGDLLRNEVRLAAAEAIETASQWKMAAIKLGIGMVVASAVLTVVLLALGFALGEAIPLWAGILISAVIAGVGAYGLINSGMKAFVRHGAAFPRTARELASDAHIIKEKIG